MNELYLAGLVLGSLLIPALTPLKFNERKTTEIFTGARPMKLYGSVNVHTLFEEFRKEAKKIWDAQPDDAKNIGDVFYEMYNGSKNGKLSTQLERMIDIETHRDSGFLTKQTIISLQPELNEHVSEKLKINQKISEIAERLEVTKPDVRNWILRYELDKEKYEKNPHYYYYADSIREGKGLPDPPSELIYDRKIPVKFETNISVMDQSNQRGNFIEKEIQNAPIPINIKHIEQPLRQSSNQNKIEKINVTLPKNVQSIKSDKPHRDNKIKPGNKNENSRIEKRNKIESINPSNIQLKSKNDLERNNTKAPLNIPVKSPGVRFQNPPKSEQRWNSPQTKRSRDLGHSSFEGGNNPHQYTLRSMGIDSINHIDNNSFIKINKRAKNIPRLLPSTSLWSRFKKLFQSKYKIHVNTFKNSTKWLSNSKNDSGKSKKQNSKTKQKQYNDDIITQILDYLIEGKSVKWISKVTGVDIDFIRDTEKKLDSTTDKRTSGREKNTEHHKYQKVVIEPKVIREFHGLEQLPLCCDLPLDRELGEKISQLPTELQSELRELMEYGFQPFAMKDWMTKEILSEITDRDPNLLRDEKFRKSKLDFRDPSSWGDILKGSGEFNISWKEGKYALLHEVFFSAFYNRVLTEAEDYLHHSFTRDHPKLKGFVREVIEFLDNKFDPEENHGRIVVDTSALTEIYSATMNAKLQSFMIYLTHDIKFDKAREILKNSTTLITKRGSLGNSFDYLITVDRNKLGCNLDKKGSRFLITYGEVKGVTEHYTSEKGSRGTYLETTVSSKNGNRILMAEDFMIKVSEIRYHLQDRYRKLNWDFQSLIDVYKQISEDYAAMIPLGRVTEGRTRFTEMFSNRNSSRSPYHLFENYNNDFNIKRLEYIELTDRYSSPLNLSNAEIVPNPSKEFRKKYSVYTEGGKFPNEIVDPFSKSDSKFVNDLLKKSFGKHSRRILTYFGTSQNGKSTSIKCGFSGRLNDVKDDYLTVVYISESIMNSKNSVSYGKEHLKGNKHNNRWGQLGAKSMVAGKFADPEIAIKNDIIKHYKGLYNQNTRKATNFRRARRTNWKKAISVLLKKGLVGEARRYQKHANIILSAFHDHITSFNTKIQAFRPIEDVD